ncbi:MAG TPA: substrate-binding domain-containing protein [Caproiciproducens sp.]|nr:substrate-binding domain-containing protein [Caproiciproducens sp.]
MKGLLALLVAALAIIAFLFYTLIGSADSTQNEQKTLKQPKYHIQVITQNTDEHFWTMFKKGASAAGSNLNTYVEFVDIPQKDTDTSIQTIERAVSSKVDGIALQALDIAKTSAALARASSRNIPAVTFENELGDIKGVSTVGSNSYTIGQQEGAMAVNACKGGGKTAIIVNGANDPSGQSKNLKLQGIFASLSKHPGFASPQVYMLDSGMFETEKLMNKILLQNPNLKLIICTDERSTPGVAQVIVDSNRVGDIAIVGYGAMPQTLKYIEHGVIYGAVCPDAYHIGYQTVAQLCDILDKKQVTDSFNTDLFSITRQNVGRYMVQTNEK